MKLPKDIYRNWREGVINAIRADELPAEASPRGIDSALRYVGAGGAVVGKRNGASLVNDTMITDGVDPVAITSQYIFRHYDASTVTFTPYHLLVTDDGQLLELDKSDGSVSVVDATAFSDLFTQMTWATLKNIAVAANVENILKVVDGGPLTVQEFGILRPTIGTFNATSSGTTSASDPLGPQAGDHYFRVTYYNDLTGHESSASDSAGPFSLTANRTVNLTNVPVSGDAQVTKRYIYVLQPSGTTYYRVGEIANNSATSVTVDWHRDNIFIVAPGRTERDRPNADGVACKVRAVETHGSRLFAICSNYLYWSKIEDPEAFGATTFEPVNPSDGQINIALKSFNNQVLVVFKERSMWGLFGIDPNEWELRVIDPTIGCVAPNSVVLIEGKLYWWSQQGPMMWDGFNAPKYIGQELVPETVDPLQINSLYETGIVAVADPPRRRLMWSFPEVGKQFNSAILPYNYEVGRFEASKWQAMDVASFVEAQDTLGQTYVYVGGYYGRVYKWWDAINDGARRVDGSTTFTLVGSPTASAAATSDEFTDSGATFDGTRLVGLYVCLLNPAKNYYVRRRITAVSSGTVTVDVAWGVAIDSTWTYLIAAPMFEWDTKWSDFGDPFLMKRFMFAYSQAVGSIERSDFYLDVFTDFVDTVVQRSFVSDVASGASVWDEDIWDSAFWSIDTLSHARKGIARTGLSYKFRVRHYDPRAQFILLRLGCESRSLTEKR